MFKTFGDCGICGQAIYSWPGGVRYWSHVDQRHDKDHEVIPGRVAYLKALDQTPDLEEISPGGNGNYGAG